MSFHPHIEYAVFHKSERKLADAGEALAALLPQIRETDRPRWRARVAETRAEVRALLAAGAYEEVVHRGNLVVCV